MVTPLGFLWSSFPLLVKFTFGSESVEVQVTVEHSGAQMATAYAIQPKWSFMKVQICKISQK